MKTNPNNKWSGFGALRTLHGGHGLGWPSSLAWTTLCGPGKPWKVLEKENWKRGRPLRGLVCLGKPLQSMVTSPAWGQLRTGLAPLCRLQQEAARLSHQAARGTFSAQRARVGCHAKERGPQSPSEPPSLPHLVFPQLLCRRIVGGGGRLERRQGQQSWFPGKCSFCVVCI